MAETYRRSRIGVYPTRFGWVAKVVAPDGSRWTGPGHTNAADARKAARRSARFYDQLERDRVDGVESVRTDKVLERGVRLCTKCGKPHDRVATTRRGKRWGQTWESPDCGPYYAESWEEFARRQMKPAEVAA